MQHVEAETTKGCVILPFNPKAFAKEKLQTTSLAALIAVTVLHDAGISAEDKLMEIIERSGEAEILDSEEAYADLGLEEMDVATGNKTLAPANDNSVFEAL